MVYCLALSRPATRTGLAFAGRVFKSKPAPTNLEVPPHKYLSDARLLIGADDSAGA